MIDSRFSINLRQIRKDYGLTQGQLGKILDITKVQVSYYERGVSHPKADLVTRIAQYFNIPINQLIEPPSRSYFYFREIVKGNKIVIDNIPSSNGMDKFTGIPGLIEISSQVTRNPYTPISNDISTHANFMVLIPSENNELANFFYENFRKLPEQPIQDLFQYEYWELPPADTLYRDGFALLHKIFSATNQGAWINSQLAQPATDVNILALLLPKNNHIIRLFIQSEKQGCRLHATYSKELEKLIVNWLQEDPKVSKSKAREYCLKVMKAETAIEDSVEEQHANTDVYDEEYNLKRFLEQRGTKLIED